MVGSCSARISPAPKGSGVTVLKKVRGRETVEVGVKVITTVLAGSPLDPVIVLVTTESDVDVGKVVRAVVVLSRETTMVSVTKAPSDVTVRTMVSIVYMVVVGVTTTVLRLGVPEMVLTTTTPSWVMVVTWSGSSLSVDVVWGLASRVWAETLPSDRVTVRMMVE